jgi:hypothetical protein
MAKFFGIHIMVYLAALIVCIILTNLYFKIDKNDLPQVVMWSFTSICSIFGFVITMILKHNKTEREKQNVEINSKTNDCEFQTFKHYVECQMTLFSETVKQQAGIFEEARTNVEYMVKNNKAHNAEILKIVKKLAEQKDE